MHSDQFRRSMAVFPMSSAMKLTGLSARQIRYYEVRELIAPERTSGGTRLFSMNDLERLLDIKMYLEKGFTMSRISELVHAQSSSDMEIDILMKKQLGKPLVNRSDLSRFFN